MYRLFIVLSFAAAAQDQYGEPKVLATVQIPKLTESSGVAASRKYPGVLWTHNDSGGGPWLFALDRMGKERGRWRVTAARSSDWEDIAIGPGPRKGWYLYVGDIGDNQRSRKSVTVYRVPEPDPQDASGATAASASIRLRYPDGPHDAECLMVHPKTGDLYLVTKARGQEAETAVYRAKAPHSTTSFNAMERVGTVNLPSSAFTLIVGRVTGGDISPDGTRVVLCDYFHAWEAVVPRGKFDAVWAATWRKVDAGSRSQGEAICYRHDGKALLATSEGEKFPLIEMLRTAAGR